MPKLMKDRTQTSTSVYRIAVFPGGGVVPEFQLRGIFLFTYAVPGVVTISPSVLHQGSGYLWLYLSVGILDDFVMLLPQLSFQGVGIHRQSSRFKASRASTA